MAAVLIAVSVIAAAAPLRRPRIEGMPTTIFASRTGRVSAVHTGQYQTEAILADDIQRYGG